MDEHKISGIHCVFYYYGTEHLIINVYDYINKGIEKNELIYLCVDPEMQKIMFDYLHKYNTQIQTLNIPKLINYYDNKDMLREFLSYEKSARKKGYTGIRIINQVNYLLKGISNEQFLSFENLFNEIIKELNVSIMCAYDFDEYLSKKHVVNEVLMEQSLKMHSHRFYNFKVVKNTECL